VRFKGQRTRGGEDWLGILGGGYEKHLKKEVRKFLKETPGMQDFAEGNQSTNGKKETKKTMINAPHASRGGWGALGKLPASAKKKEEAQGSSLSKGPLPGP